MSVRAYVRAVALWSPRFASAEAYLSGAAAPEPSEQAAAELLPRRARGRASQLLRALTEVLRQLSEAGGADLASVPVVYGSALGELQTTAALLQMMHEGDGALSPARFQASVHNNAAGQLSIACENRSFSTTIAAGGGTVGAAVAEALVTLGPDRERVLLLLADERPPSFVQPEVSFEPLAVGFDLGRTPGSAALGELRDLSFVAVDGEGDAHWLQHNPVSPALGLIRALHADAPGRTRLGNPGGGYYEVGVNPAGAHE